MAFKGRVSKDFSDGRVSVSDGEGFIARLVNGSWERNKMFSADDFKDNFNIVFDEAEAKRLINEAKASLGMDRVFKLLVMPRSVFASVSDDGRIAVSDLKTFVAGFEDGTWVNGKVFSADDFKDNFNPVWDDNEAMRLLKESEIALANSPSNNPFFDVQTLGQAAIKFAAEKHKEQKVPGTDLPYVIHLSNAAMEIFMAAIHTPDFNLTLAIPTALLHDTIEDTNTTADEIEAHFGKAVTEAVLALTKNKNLPKDLTMADSLGRIRQQPKEVWAVKLADRITNLQSPPAHWDEEKKKEYLEEAGAIYEALKDGNEYLANRLKMKIQEYERYLGNASQERSTSKE